MRKRIKDGFANRLELYFTTHFGTAWALIESTAPLRRWFNRFLINRALAKVPPRPNPLSTKCSYTSWDSLTDRTYFGRHLPPAPAPAGRLPSAAEAANLFERRGDTIQCPKSTVLFAYFAQWFTHGFIRSDDSEPRRNTSNHNIDLSQLYGSTEAATQSLCDEDGLLKSQFIEVRGGHTGSTEPCREEFPCYLCDEEGNKKPEFEPLAEPVGWDKLTDTQKQSLFAMGGDTTNLHPGFAMLNVLFLREHNRIARMLGQKYPAWEGDQLFATTRNVLTVLLLKVVIEEYINHIAPYHFRFAADPTPFGNEHWYRQNWLTVEFNLLYRWHPLMPSTLRIDGRSLPTNETLYNNEGLTSRGLGPNFEDASKQPAGRIGLFNTDPDLCHTERASLSKARDLGLASYNAYRAHCGFPRVTDFDQISGDPQVQSSLRKVYGNVDRIEFYVGLFAEDARTNSVLPPLMGRMVGVDAFSQALTNPLLAPRIFDDDRTFSPQGKALIRTTRCLSDLLHRNSLPSSRRYLASLTRQDWRRA